MVENRGWLQGDFCRLDTVTNNNEVQPAFVRVGQQVNILHQTKFRNQLSHLFSKGTDSFLHVNIDVARDDHLDVVGTEGFDQGGEFLYEQGGEKREGRTVHGCHYEWTADRAKKTDKFLR